MGGYHNLLCGYERLVRGPRRSRKMTRLRSLKVTLVENTFADTALNLFLHCDRMLFCPHPLLEERVDSRQQIAHE
jgi:hypothetical protein